MKTYLVMAKRILILYENKHYITPYKKNCSFLNIYFSFYHFRFYFTLEAEGVLFFFNGVLFAQEIPKELNLLCIYYDVALMLENVESQK